ncbi:MAG: hypothetical protein ABI222_13960 [Opitutaceae bacterium]
MISARFAQVLRSGRDHFNKRFAAARHSDPQLDWETFTRFLADVVDPLVQAVDLAAPEHTADFATHAYDVGLELATLRLIGTAAKNRAVEAAWQRALPPAARLVAAHPRRALAAISNAAHQLAVNGSTRHAEWVSTVAQLAPQSANLDDWLKVGEVAAWRAGLAHYRSSALTLCETLTEPLALAAVGAPSHASWPKVRAELLANPWHDPANPHPATALRVTRQAGGFRGFGREFSERPVVVAQGEHFVATSGDTSWVLIADAFGATLHRATEDEQAVLQPVSLSAGKVSATGTRVVTGDGEIDLGEFGPITSVAANGTTIAVTAQLTYAVVLIARPGK